MLSMPVAAKNSFLVAPGKVLFDMNKTTTETFIVTNTGDNKIRLEMEVLYIPIGEDGLKVGKHIRVGVDEDENISDNVRVSPKRMRLEPGQRRDIKVQLKPLAGAKDGDYRTHLVVKMVENAVTQEINPDNNEQMNMKLNIKMETAVAIYARKGEAANQLSPTCSAKGKGFSYDVVNASPYKFDGFIQVADSPISPYVQLRESERSIVLGLPKDQRNISLFDSKKELIFKTECK